jgi:phosphoribosylamine--glycine ligase
VVAVSGGYPEAYQKGKTIKGLASSPNSTVFHAGTTLQEGEILTNGGRVLAVTSLGDNYKDALSQSYKLLEEIGFEGMYYRKDIGFDL